MCNSGVKVSKKPGGPGLDFHTKIYVRTRSAEYVDVVGSFSLLKIIH